MMMMMMLLLNPKHLQLPSLYTTHLSYSTRTTWVCDWGELEESGAALKHFLIHDSCGWVALAENLRVCDTVKTNTPRLSIKGMGGVNLWRRRASCSQSQGQSMKNSTGRQGKPPSVTGSVFTIVKSKQQHRLGNTECLVLNTTYKSSNCCIPISEQGTVVTPGHFGCFST